MTESSNSLAASWMTVGSDRLGKLPHLMYRGLFIFIILCFPI